MHIWPVVPESTSLTRFKRVKNHLRAPADFAEGMKGRHSSRALWSDIVKLEEKVFNDVKHGEYKRGWINGIA